MVSGNNQPGASKLFQGLADTAIMVGGSGAVAIIMDIAEDENQLRLDLPVQALNNTAEQTCGQIAVAAVACSNSPFTSDL